MWGVGVGLPGPVEFGCLEAVAGGRGARRSAADARSTLDDRAGICGAAVMVIEDLLAPTNVERLLTKRVQPDTLTRSA